MYQKQHSFVPWVSVCIRHLASPNSPLLIVWPQFRPRKAHHPTIQIVSRTKDVLRMKYCETPTYYMPLSLGAVWMSIVREGPIRQSFTNNTSKSHAKRRRLVEGHSRRDGVDKASMGARSAGLIDRQWQVWKRRRSAWMLRGPVRDGQKMEILQSII